MLGDFHAGCEHNSCSDLGEIAGGHGSENMPFTLEGPYLEREGAAGRHQCHHLKLAVLRLENLEELFYLAFTLTSPNAKEQMSHLYRSRQASTLFFKRIIFHSLNKCNTSF